MEASSAYPHTPPPRVPLLSRILIGFVALLTVLALLGTWVDRQLLDRDQFAKTSAALLRDPDIRVPVANAIAGQIADGSRAADAVNRIGSELPPALGPAVEAASGAAATATRDAVQEATQRVLANAEVQRAWVDATLAAQQVLIRAIDGQNLQQVGDTIYLDLRPVAVQVAQQLGFSGTRIGQLPADRTRVAVMQADQLESLQTAANVLDALSWLPAILALLLAALAVEIARGARRSALLAVGITLVGSAILALALQRLAGRRFVDAITDGGPMQTAAESAWQIASDLLVALGVVVIVIGLIVTFGAWLVGPSRAATRLRRWLRPALAHHPALVYGAIGVLFLAVAAWSPLSAFARIWPLVLLGALLAFGLVVVHRRVVENGAVASGLPLVQWPEGDVSATPEPATVPVPPREQPPSSERPADVAPLAEEPPPPDEPHLPFPEEDQEPAPPPAAAEPPAPSVPPTEPPSGTEPTSTAPPDAHDGEPSSWDGPSDDRSPEAEPKDEPGDEPPEPKPTQ